MECLGHPKPEMFDVFGKAMEKHYPGMIDFSQPWVYSIAGGAMIQMKLYYASLTEYIMIWGTPIGSEGHSGRHFTGFWDTVIDGEMWYYGEGEFEKKIYKPGDRVYVGPGQARAMNFTDGVWAVEYARGFLPAEMPFGVISEYLICTDLIAATQTWALYTDLVAQSIGHKVWPLRPLTWLISKINHGITMALSPSPEVTVIPEDRNIRWFQRKV
jgi:C-8 sterol isomerase